jgi:hypothetical protein
MHREPVNKVNALCSSVALYLRVDTLFGPHFILRKLAA